MFSLIAMVPEREFRKPILIVSPSVLTQLVPALPPVELGTTLLPPQAVRASAAADGEAGRAEERANARKLCVSV